MKRFLAAFFLFCTFAATLWAGNDPATPAPDKSQYNLFQPTPIDLLRSFAADRPSQSTGPYTVDAGHFYFETSVVGFLYDEPDARTTVRQWNVLPFNFRLGLTNNVELDLAYGDYFHVRTRSAGQTTTQSGFGDFILQSKINLFGNDGGAISFGLIPFLKFPTNSGDLGNDSIEGGLSVPFQASLPAGFSLGLLSGVNFVRNGADTRYEAQFINAVLLSHSLISPKLSAYGEFYSVVTRGDGGGHAAYFDAGLVYQIRPNAEIDFGCNFGLTKSAPDFQPFTGFAFRF
ncbi:MAG: transporter [Chthoniobacterales bacterium]